MKLHTDANLTANIAEATVNSYKLTPSLTRKRSQVQILYRLYCLLIVLKVSASFIEGKRVLVYLRMLGVGVHEADDRFLFE